MKKFHLVEQCLCYRGVWIEAEDKDTVLYKYESGSYDNLLAQLDFSIGDPCNAYVDGEK